MRAYEPMVVMLAMYRCDEIKRWNGDPAQSEPSNLTPAEELENLPSKPPSSLQRQSIGGDSAMYFSTADVNSLSDR